MVFLINFGFKNGDCARFLDRLADQLAEVLNDEVMQLHESDRASAQAGVMLSRFLLPFALRLVLNAGLQLAINHRDNRQDAVSKAVARTFIAEAQEFVVQTIVRASLRDLARLGQNEGDRVSDISEQVWAEASILMQTIHQGVADLLAQNADWQVILTTTFEALLLSCDISVLCVLPHHAVAPCYMGENLRKRGSVVRFHSLAPITIPTSLPPGVGGPSKAHIVPLHAALSRWE
jgi:hypothetical protein